MRKKHEAVLAALLARLAELPEPAARCGTIAIWGPDVTGEPETWLVRNPTGIFFDGRCRLLAVDGVGMIDLPNSFDQDADFGGEMDIEDVRLPRTIKYFQLVGNDGPSVSALVLVSKKTSIRASQYVLTSETVSIQVGR